VALRGSLTAVLPRISPKTGPDPGRALLGVLVHVAVMDMWKPFENGLKRHDLGKCTVLFSDLPLTTPT